MPIFQRNVSKLSLINEKSIDIEKDVQQITEQNLDLIFGLKFVTSEFQLNNLRIDTLAFDEESKAFVIIEYKKERNFSVIDQGYAYLALLLNNKADFILEYNERMSHNLMRDSVDWSQSRVIFVSPQFSTYQQNAINFKDLPIHLWEVHYYDNNMVLYHELKAAATSESIKTITKDKTVEAVSREVSQYTIDDHVKPDWKVSRELYDYFKRALYELDSRFEESPTKYYIGYKIGNTVIFDIQIRKGRLLLELYRVRPEDLKDSEKRVTYKKNSFDYYNKHVSVFAIESLKDIPYAIWLIRQLELFAS